ncbi:odorant receptor 43a-like [Harpegnathos saltator]|uniref:odorant receptor 43a-like n=1 Tax=Harpegnathos saltator TaxID=610380 RepID=UPI000948DD64|nr:odorant receptor 43a-like [Harpegnathos saltator]
MKHSSGNEDLEWTINLNRFMLRIAGLWPPDHHDASEAVKSKIQLLYNFITILIVLAIPSLLSLIRVWGDTILMIENMQYSIPYLSTIFKICIIWYRQADLLPLIHMIEKDWAKPKMKEERNIMLKYARTIRLIAMCGLSSTLLALISTCGYSCFEIIFRHVANLTNPTKLPLPVHYLHDVSKSPQYELTLLAQITTLFICGFSYTAVDQLFGLLVLHVCGQLESLNLRLTRMEQYTNFDATLKYNVQDHVRLIKSIEIIDDAFDLMLLVLIFYFAIIFCLEGFLIVNIINRKDQLPLKQFIWFITGIVYILIHTCLYCAIGEIIVTQSEKISQATYEHPWYNLKPRAAKNLMLIMHRASKPLQITAGKIFPMTMIMFSNLLKTSASYISVLLAIQD